VSIDSPTGAAGSDERISIIVLPQGDLGKQLLDILVAWSTSGLLTPSLCVEPEAVETSPDQAPTVPCWHLGSWGKQQDDLFEVLSRRKRRLVRVVGAQILVSASMLDDRQIKVAGQVLDTVRDSLPDWTRLEHDAYVGTELRSINVIAGVTGLASVPVTASHAGWDVNVVTSPEDRRDPSRANVFVRHPGNLVPVAASTIASVAGLFVGMGNGPFDGMRTDPSSTFGKVTVVRATVRTLLMDRVVEGVARDAALEAILRGGPAFSDPDLYVATPNPSALVERAVGWTEEADHAAFSYRPETSRDGESTIRVALTNSLAAFLTFANEALVSVVLTVYGWIVRRAEGAATRLITGSESGIEITLRPTVAPSLGREAVVSDEEHRALVALRITAAERATAPGPTRALWASVRSLVCGLLDGVGLPEGFEAPTDGTRRVVIGRADHIGPRPDDVFIVSADVALVCEIANEETVIGPLDAERYRDVEETLRTTHTALAKLLADLDRRLAEARHVLSSMVDGVDGTAAAAAKVDDLAAQYLAAAQQAELIAAELSSLSDWFRRRADSYFWRLRDGLSSKLRRAGTEEETLRTLVAQAATIDAEEPARLHKRFVRRVLVWAVVVTATCYGVLGSSTPWADRATAYPATTIGLWALLAVSALVFILARYYHGILSFLKRFRESLELRHSNLLRLVSVMKERRRLQIAKSQLEQWSRIYGWCFHLPWSDEPPPLEKAGARIDPSLLPASMRLAEAELRDDGERQKATEVGVRALTRPGWRERAFSELVVQNVRSDDDAEIEQAVARMDSDEYPDTGPLGKFRAALDGGRLQELVLNHVLLRAEDELREQHLGQARLSVTLDRLDPHEPTDLPAEAFLAGLLVPASPLAKETWSPGALVDGLHMRLATVLWLPADLCSAAPAGVDVREVEDTALGRVAVRMDMAGPLDVSSLRLFSDPDFDAPIDGPSDSEKFG
jgi:hypothetical protein